MRLAFLNCVLLHASAFFDTACRPPVHLLLREIDLCQDPANVLRHKIIDRFRPMIDAGTAGMITAPACWPAAYFRDECD